MRVWVPSIKGSLPYTIGEWTPGTTVVIKYSTGCTNKCISVDGEAVEPLKECVAFSLKLLPPDKGGMSLSDLASIWSVDLEGRLRMSSRVQMNWVIAKRGECLASA